MSRNRKLVPLNRDHKPNLADEAERIHQKQGRIVCLRPLRVWIKEATSRDMKRSLGDEIAQSVGVTYETEI